jgi:hypothetical protein
LGLEYLRICGRGNGGSENVGSVDCYNGGGIIDGGKSTGGVGGRESQCSICGRKCTSTICCRQNHCRIRRSESTRAVGCLDEYG